MRSLTKRLIAMSGRRLQSSALSLKLLFIVFLYAPHIAADPTSKPFNCEDIQRKHSWREIESQCLMAPIIKSYDDYILDLSKEEPDKINAFMNSKVEIRIGIRIVDHLSYDEVPLVNLSFPKLEKITNDHHQGLFEIIGCKGLQVIEFPKLREISIKHGQFLILRNRNLESLVLHPNAVVGADIRRVEIGGNNVLNAQDVAAAAKMFARYVEGNHIQKEGECMFPGEIESPTELEGCTYVFGDLLFKKGAEGGKINTRLANVTGCVNIVETRMKSMFFLHGTEYGCKGVSKIINNPFMEDCHTVSIKPNNVAFEMKNNCQGTCLVGETMYKDKLCEYVKESISITGDNKLYEVIRLQKARVVYGTISIKNTIFQEMTWLSKLETIADMSAKVPAIEITGNKAMKKMDFSSLKNITVPSSVKVIIRIRNNTNFSLSEDVYKQLLKVVGGNEERLDVDRFSEIQKRQEESEGKDKEDVNAEEEEKTETRNAILMGVIIPVGVILIVGGIVAGVVVVVLKRKKKSKKGKNDKGDAEHGGGKPGKGKVHPTGAVTDGSKVMAVTASPANVEIVDGVVVQTLNMDETDEPKPDRSLTQNPENAPSVATNTKTKAPSNYESVHPEMKTKIPSNYESIHPVSTTKQESVIPVTAATMGKTTAKTATTKPPSNYRSMQPAKTAATIAKPQTVKAVTAATAAPQGEADYEVISQEK